MSSVSGAVVSILSIACVLATACASSESVSSSAELPDDGQLEPLRDENPDPKVVEVHVEAKVGTKTFANSPATPVWSYNGTIPGPLIDARVGEQLVVHFKNSLPEPTTIHWHGVRLPNTMDGTPAVQAPIQPGASFDYVFTLKDAGLFWFHPHVRSDVQINKGLYGVLRVRADQEPNADQEKIVVLDDIKLKPDGTIPEYLDDTSRMMGRGGNTVLLNGVANAVLRFRPNSTVRLRIVNVANGRFFNLSLPGLKFRVIGTDGGLIPHPYEVDRLLIAPAERYDVLVRIPGEAGTSVALRTDAYDRGHDSGSDPPLPVATINVEGVRVAEHVNLDEVTAAITKLPQPAGEFSLTLDEKSLPTGEVVFTINDKTFPDVPMLSTANGDVRAINIRNDSEMDHPFHLHGFFFQVVERNGAAVAEADIVNKDTVIVAKKSSLRVLARFDEPGMWMYHCHIPEHSEHGMMGHLHVQ